MPPGSFMLSNMAGFPSSLWLNNCMWWHVFLSIHPQWTLGCSIFWLLWVMLQQTWGCRHLFKIAISFPLDTFPLDTNTEVDLLGHMEVLLLILEALLYCFPWRLWKTYIPSDTARGFPRLPISPTLVISCLSDNLAYFLRGECGWHNRTLNITEKLVAPWEKWEQACTSC